jgi:hypothetical protein
MADNTSMDDDNIPMDSRSMRETAEKAFSMSAGLNNLFDEALGEAEGTLRASPSEKARLANIIDSRSIPFMLFDNFRILSMMADGQIHQGQSRLVSNALGILQKVEHAGPEFKELCDELVSFAEQCTCSGLGVEGFQLTPLSSNRFTRRRY